MWSCPRRSIPFCPSLFAVMRGPGRSRAEGGYVLYRLQQRMALLPRAQLDDALGGEIGEGDGLHLALDRAVVEAGAAALDEAPRLAVGGGEAGADEGLEGGK